MACSVVKPTIGFICITWCPASPNLTLLIHQDVAIYRKISTRIEFQMLLQKVVFIDYSTP